MIAINAIDRPAGAGFKGDLGFLTAFTAFDGEELAGGGRRKGLCPFFNLSLRSFRSAGGPAGRTALGRMIMAFSLEGLLFFYSENVGCFAIEADQRLFL